MRNKWRVSGKYVAAVLTILTLLGRYPGFISYINVSIKIWIAAQDDKHNMLEGVHLILV